MSADLARLRWRSRRGMRELDAVLRSFVQRSSPTSMPTNSLGSSRFSNCRIPSSSPTLRGEVSPKTPTSRASSNGSARAIDLRPERLGMLRLVARAAWARLAAARRARCAVVVKARAALRARSRDAAGRPPCATRSSTGATAASACRSSVSAISRSAGATATPRLGPVRPARAGRALDILLLADQIDPEAWRRLPAALRRFRPATGTTRPRSSQRPSRGAILS